MTTEQDANAQDKAQLLQDADLDQAVGGAGDGSVRSTDGATRAPAGDGSVRGGNAAPVSDGSVRGGNATPVTDGSVRG